MSSGERELSIIHAANIAALVIAILYPQQVTAEQAFNLYDTGSVKEMRTWGIAKERVARMHEMRKNGMKWKEIAKIMGMSDKNHGNSAASYYTHNRYLLEEDGE